MGMKWIYRERMDIWNPVCVDIGEIEEILRNDHNQDGRDNDFAFGQDYGNGVDIRTTDGVFRVGEMKIHVLAQAGMCGIRRVNERISLIGVPPGLEDGAEVFLPENKDWRGNAICTDPRVLYIANRGYRIIGWGDSTKEEIDAFYRDIPTREHALEWLEREGFATDCQLAIGRIAKKCMEWLKAENARHAKQG